MHRAAAADAGRTRGRVAAGASPGSTAGFGLLFAVGVGEHPDIIDSIEKELDEIARYNDQVEMIDKYFKEMKV